MKKKHYLFLYLLSIGFYLLISSFQKTPGYMDAEYYFAEGIQISKGNLVIEPFIWNYLSKPNNTQPPSFTFWMPFTAMLSAGGLILSKVDSFTFARLFFIILAALIPVLTAFFGERFLPGKKAGWIAACFALVGVFYLPYLTITDTFTPFIVLGGLFFFIFDRMHIPESKPFIKLWGFLIIGLIVGFMHLTRADGILWLAAGAFYLLCTARDGNRKVKSILLSGLKLCFGYLIVMTPWFVRNITEFHSLFPHGNGKSLWLTSYSDIFVYPASQLTFARWLDTGILRITLDRITALGVNLQTILVVSGGIVLLPFIIVGIIQKKSDPIIRVMMFMIWLTLGVMTLVFPYAGARGSFFHSIGSVQIILWALMPFGLDRVIKFFVNKRNWNQARSWRLFTITFICLSALISGFVFQSKISKGAEGGGNWNQSQLLFTTAENALISSKIDNRQTIIVNDPPGYTLATGRSSIMIPSGGLQSIIEVSRRFDTYYMLVGSDRSEINTELSKNYQVAEHFEEIFEGHGFKIYELNP